MQSWKFLRIPRNSQKTGNSVRKGRADLNSEVVELFVYNVLYPNQNRLKYIFWRKHLYFSLPTVNPVRKILLAASAPLYLGSRVVRSQTTNSTLVCCGAENCDKCVKDPSCFWCETQLLFKVYEVKNEKNETKTATTGIGRLVRKRTPH